MCSVDDLLRRKHETPPYLCATKLIYSKSRIRSCTTMLKTENINKYQS